ncbi:MAG: hypothetical protein RL078_1215 [Bacteroidota bacterium]|jgi:hypothetical protein
MRPVKFSLILFIVYAAFVMLFSYLVFGCSAERLHQKAVKKGYTHAIHVDTFKVATIDTMWRDGKPYPVIKYKDSLVVRTEYVYIPKWRYRFDNKRFADSLSQIRAMYEAALKNALRTKKIDAKQTKHKEKHKTKQTQSENKNGFSDGMKWVAISIFSTAILLLLLIVIRAIKRYILIKG